MLEPVYIKLSAEADMLNLKHLSFIGILLFAFFLYFWRWEMCKIAKMSTNMKNATITLLLWSCFLLSCSKRNEVHSAPPTLNKNVESSYSILNVSKLSLRRAKSYWISRLHASTERHIVYTFMMLLMLRDLKLPIFWPCQKSELLWEKCGQTPQIMGSTGRWNGGLVETLLRLQITTWEQLKLWPSTVKNI